MNLPSIIVLVVTGACLAGAIAYLVRNRGKGCSDCPGGCAGCAGCGRREKKGEKRRKAGEKPDCSGSACLKGARAVENKEGDALPSVRPEQGRDTEKGG